MNNKFPKLIPIFPLSGVIYFPKTNLPLNIFEPRYLDLVNDSYYNNKLMGMVQEKKNSNEVYRIGCLGKISDLHETGDGRVIINLVGVTRFEIIKEIDNKKRYREFEVSYDNFDVDLVSHDEALIERERLKLFKDKAKVFFKKNGLLLNWKEFEKLDQSQQINTLAMIAPVSNEEKQKLLETKTIIGKTKLMLEIIEFYLHASRSDNKTLQ
jgi:Lon protease-like protein